jgi:hypothetical protein
MSERLDYSVFSGYRPDIRRNFLVPEVEIYTCDNCGQTVTGGRYNNHCPNCLFSKHVDDKLPGDRASDCKGLMKPIGITRKKGVWRIRQKCVNCGKTGDFNSTSADNMDLIIQLSTIPIIN